MVASSPSRRETVFLTSSVAWRKCLLALNCCNWSDTDFTSSLYGGGRDGGREGGREGGIEGGRDGGIEREGGRVRRGGMIAIHFHNVCLLGCAKQRVWACP